MSEAGLLALVAATHSAVFAAPFALIGAGFGEWQRIGGWLYYALVAIAIAGVGFLAQFWTEAGGEPTIVNSYAVTAFIVTGFVAGIVYWLFAGRFAAGPTAGGPAVGDHPAAAGRHPPAGGDGRAGCGLARGQVSRGPAGSRRSIARLGPIGTSPALLHCIRFLVALQKRAIISIGGVAQLHPATVRESAHAGFQNPIADRRCHRVHDALVRHRGNQHVCGVGLSQPVAVVGAAGSGELRGVPAGPRPGAREPRSPSPPRMETPLGPGRMAVADRQRRP